MEQLEKFILALGVPSSVLDEAKKEGADQKAVEKAAKDWLKDRDTIQEDKVKKAVETELKKTIGEETLKTVENTIKGKLKRELKLNVDKAKDLDDFIKDAKAEIDAEKTATDEKLKTDAETYKQKYAEAVEQLGETKTKLTEAEAAKETAIAEERKRAQSERYLDNSLAEVKWAFKDNKERIDREKRIIREEALAKFDLGEDGVIKAKDGGPAVKPDGSGVFKTISEYVEFETTRLELVEANAARAGGAGGGSGGSGGGGAADPKIDRSYSSELARQLAEEAKA